MNTQQIEQDEQVVVPELKSERVQDGLAVEAGEEPFGIELKSERVQDGLAAGKGDETFSITLTRFKPMTVNVPALGSTVDIHGVAIRPVAG